MSSRALPILFNRLAARGLQETGLPGTGLPGTGLPGTGLLEAAAVPVRADVAVVGAGVVGLSVAWRLAARGLAVALFEAGTAGGGTSAAASGMLAAAAEHEPGGDALLALALESQALWPAFHQDLERASGRSIDYRREGTLVLAVGRDEVDRLRARYELQRRAGLSTQWLTGSAAREREPGLRPSVTGAIACPDDHQVDPHLVVGALRGAFVAAGGRLIENRAVSGLWREGGRVAGLVVGDEACRADVTIVATGAAIGSASWMPPDIRLPVRPLKGQSMALRARRGPLPIDHVVWTADIHLAPKSEGRLILGATVEEAGFDTTVTAGGAFALLDAVRRVLPAVEEMAIESLWAGVRPTSEDDAPILGATPLDGLLVAAGHHRNGYLLAPVTARAIDDLVTRGQVRGAAAGFGLARFAAARVSAPGAA